MSLNDIRNEFSSDIAQIADELNNSLPMSKPQLRIAFSDQELKELHVLLKEVNEATSENDKIVKIANNAKSAFNLLKKLGVGL
jgi:adenine C2-methylase RlmN of 23S rRNA A2503 and tRNA A37